MMQQTMEASHTDSIQVQSWTLGLKQVNPSCGHTCNFFFFAVCFWNRASVSVGQSRLHLQKQLSTIKKNHWRNFSLEGVRDYPFEYSVLFILKHLCFTAQKKRIWSLHVGNLLLTQVKYLCPSWNFLAFISLLSGGLHLKFFMVSWPTKG